jgi:hypothetical protein
MNIVDLLQSPEKHIELMMSSVNYINSRLDTFYNTESERIDIQRNKEYLQIMLSKKFILENIKQEQLSYINEAIDKASSVLINNPQ